MILYSELIPTKQYIFSLFIINSCLTLKIDSISLNKIFKMRQRYFSPESSIQSNQFQSDYDGHKLRKRLRNNGSVSNPISGSLINNIQEDKNIIGNYKIQTNKLIGSGFSSKVYKALSLKTQRQFAVKVINTKWFNSASLKLLQNEIKILQRLNHPNILRCYQVFKTKQACYIVTEYCPSGDLQTYMTRNGVFSQKQAIQIINDISQGVKCLFKNNIIHRDLKPANILHGSTSWKIADFGFAIHSNSNIITKHNVGTPLYMPPQALQKNLYSHQSDIFAVGVIFYELLFGITPWECSNEKQLIYRLSSMPFRLPPKAQTKVSPSIQYILQKLCDVSQNQRPCKEQFLRLNFKNYDSIDTILLNLAQKTSPRLRIGLKQKTKQLNVAQKKTRPRILSKQIKQNQSSKKLKPRAITLMRRSESPNQLQSNRKKSKKQNIKQEYLIGQKSVSSRFKLNKNIYSPLSKLKTSKRKQTSIIKKNTPYKKNTESTASQDQFFSSSLKTSYSQKETTQSQHSTEQNIFSQKLYAQICSTNNRIVLNRLNYCRFMYYLAKNVSFISNTETQRQKIALVIFRHLIKVIKQLSDSKQNWLGLQKWQFYKQNSKYQNTHKTVSEYCKRYKKQYQAFSKTMKSNIVQEVTQKFSELEKIEPISAKRYQNIKKFVFSIIVECLNNLNQKVSFSLKTLSERQRAQTQALTSLLKYYIFLDIQNKFYQNTRSFEQTVEIEFLKDFSTSNASISQFFQTKNKINLLQNLK